MQIVFDPAFDRSAWPGPLGESAAAVGEVWTGEAGLLGLLETELGLGGPVTPDAIRAASLVPALDVPGAFWFDSYRNDPQGTARTLLQWRDMLWMNGWQGQPVAPRLADLARAARDLAPGQPDRLAAVAGALATRQTGIVSLTRLLPIEEPVRLWQQVFEALRAQGVKVTEREVPPVAARGNLAGARQAGFDPVAADDRLQFLCAPGPLESAERLSGWMAGLPDRSGMLVVGADPVLDAALHRYGLPSTGAAGGVESHALLQVLPLVLAAGWMPPDPRAVLDLLLLPTGPVPPFLARRLSRALHEWPAVGSECWNKSLGEGLERIEDPDSRAALSERLAMIFSPEAKHGERYPAAAVVRRIAGIRQWMRNRRHAGAGDPASWDAAMEQCAVLEALLVASQSRDVTQAMLQRLVEDATAQISLPPVFPAEAGLAAVHAPEAVVGPVSCLVWWNFTSGTTVGMQRLPFMPTEIAALKAAGVELPDPVRAALVKAQRWRRPLLQTTERLVFAGSARGPDGATRAPHPLWDEILAHVKDGDACRAASRLQCNELVPSPRQGPVTRRRQTLPAPRGHWHLRGPVPCRKIESPSGAGSLVGCPFRWVLQYAGELYAGETRDLPDAALLKGSLAHAILADILKKLPETSDVAAQRAQALFDERGPILAAAMFLPGAEAARVAARAVIVEAARDLVERLRQWNLSRIRCEESQARRAPKMCGDMGVDLTLKGRPDLVVEPPLRVIDFKWGGETYLRSVLENGGAYQLAAYGFTLSGSGDAGCVPGAYYILSRRRLITNAPGLFPGAEEIRGPDAQSVWEGLAGAYAERRREMAGGAVTATAIEETEADAPPPKKDGLVDGRLVLLPTCHYCDYGMLCGIAIGE